jgi:FkbM family methyltransferase
MPAASETAALVACRSEIAAALDEGDFRTAEERATAGVEQWPDRIGLHISLAKALDGQDRRAEARSVLEAQLRSRHELPRWAVLAFAKFGFAIASGVKVDFEDDAIAHVLRHHFVSGEYERTECDFLAEALRPNDRILEVGGGIGFVGTFAKLREPTAQVVSFEANPALLPIANRTRSLNDVHFEMHNAMLGPADGRTDFFVNKQFWASSQEGVYGGEQRIEVPVHSIDRVMAEGAFTLVVMDIEGGEIDLIPQMDLSTVDRMVVETHPQVTGARSVRTLLKKLRRQYGFASQRHEHGVHYLARQR